jgi:teneurin
VTFSFVRETKIDVINEQFAFADINKGSPIDYKSGETGSACSTPTKETLKYDRAYSGGHIPARGIGLFGGSATGTLVGTHHHMNPGPPSHHHHHYSTPLNFRKGFTSKCSWKCTAILVIMLCVVLLSILVYMSGKLLNCLFKMYQLINLCLQHQQ